VSLWGVGCCLPSESVTNSGASQRRSPSFPWSEKSRVESYASAKTRSKSDNWASSLSLINMLVYMHALLIESCHWRFTYPLNIAVGNVVGMQILEAFSYLQ
jgi:hypothetical protein